MEDFLSQAIWTMYTIFVFIVVTAATVAAVGSVIYGIVYLIKELLYGQNKTRQGRRILQTNNPQQQKRNKTSKPKNKTARKGARLPTK